VNRGYLNGFLRILQQENAMNTERTPLNDKELWRSLAAVREDAPETVSDLDFAAWLEGRLSETAAARVEVAVAADPEMRRAALELADILGKPLPAPPASRPSSAPSVSACSTGCSPATGALPCSARWRSRLPS
jgi:hypothetical protein